MTSRLKSRSAFRSWYCLLAVVWGLLVGLEIESQPTVRLSAQEPRALKIQSPLPYQVIQREGFVPPWVEDKPLRGTARGGANIIIQAEMRHPKESFAREARVVLLDGGTGTATRWISIDPPVTTGQKANHLRIPAGGWYRLEVRDRQGERIITQGAVEPIGVGEVFVVAGQSYASNSNDEQFRVQDAHGRVSAYNSDTGTWAIAHDPQPTGDKSTAGSIWPPMGDAFVAQWQVPIGIANVAVGGTSSTQWLPEGPLHQRLVKAGTALGSFRGVLWQQGESDVIANASTAEYVDRVVKIRSAAAAAWKWEPTWLLAKSTLHPTVYTKPKEEGQIRAAIDELIQLPGFQAGPDTDTLTGENRGDRQSKRHFSPIGQKRAAEMWLASINQQFFDPLAQTPAVRLSQAELDDLLRAPLTSPKVIRESSVLLKSAPDAAPIARLGFPAGRILEVATASREHSFVQGRDYSVSEDGLTLTFKDPGPIEPIATADFFPPQDAPNSYRHRAGHPDQNLLYRPGRWFHDHNIEVTYERRSRTPDLGNAASASPAALLPQTLARLQARQPLTIGMSGDSISTGLDASSLTQVAPFQLGYPDLITAALHQHYGSEVVLRNRAIGGWSVAHGVQDLEKMLAGKPDLIIVAYGMNDVGRRDPAWYGGQTKTIVDRIRAAQPESEIILVSPMLGHNEWVHTPREMFAQYRDELRKLTGPGVALADVTDAWATLLKHKHDFDLTGNGLNHPNDYGHRLYAQVILQLLQTAK